MAVDIELATNLIQAKIATLQSTGLVQTVPLTMEAYATSLHDAICPYVMTWPSEGQWAQKGGGYKMESRVFTVTCFVESLAQKDIPTRTHQGVQVLQAMRNLFVVAANIPLDSGSSTGYQITVESREGAGHSDTGLTARLPFGGFPWFGFQLRLNVRIMWIV